MSKSLIIVESPAKTKTLKTFLGDEYRIEASMGHVCDLPKKNLGVDVAQGFKPKYVPIPERKSVLSHLKDAAAEAKQVYLATDPDREGEAIAWHLVQALKLDGAKRISFNEITRSAVREALEHPRDVDENLFSAQQARRILDRLVGYKLSPLLWSKVKKYLSAGRVQSVTVRLICDREREIQAFVPEEYWSITAELTKLTELKPFSAKLIEKDGKKIKPASEAETNDILRDLEGATYTVADVKERDEKRHPHAPFTTSTLQQEAARKLKFSNKMTMGVAQDLYEGIGLGAEGSVGLITYMRTDSARVAGEAIAEARKFIQAEFGKDYLPASPRQYKSKKSAQDAHEAIRPTSVFRKPEDVEKFLTSEQFKLYKLIWQRFLASQMESATLHITTANIAAENYTFRATSSVVKFPGFMTLYIEGIDNGGEEDERQVLPELSKGEALRLLELIPKQHFTEPPPRYTQATLVKALEEKGIGRPSTYAAIISTIQDRKYARLDDRKFMPTELGFTVTDLLVKHFPDVMDVEFTAGVETKLDDIEEGDLDWVKVLSEFWEPFHASLEDAQANMETVKKPPQETGEMCPDCGRPLVIRESKYGQFLGCSGYPDCKKVVSKNLGESCPVPGCSGRLVEAKSGSPRYRCSNYPVCGYVTRAKAGPFAENEKAQTVQPGTETDQTCPKCGRPLVLRMGKYGEFLGCSGYPKCRTIVNVRKSVGVACPVEGCDGEIVERRSKKGRTFYGCSRYPQCKFASWDKPLDRRCPRCGSLLVEERRNGRVQAVKCIGRQCMYREEQTEEADGEALAS
ncbi:MAG TPA: type I DNA topoisomerase [Armatimonadota bacterium]|nr:type I DNA topoisomerase [Armatimonadota bacterium]